jgi:hypothetical protein
VRFSEAESTQETLHFCGDAPYEGPAWLALSQSVADPEKAPPEIAAAPGPQSQSVAPPPGLQSSEMNGTRPASGTVPPPLPLLPLLGPLGGWSDVSGDSLVVPLAPFGKSVPPQFAATIAEDNPRSNVVIEARMTMILSKA